MHPDLVKTLDATSKSQEIRGTEKQNKWYHKRGKCKQFNTRQDNWSCVSSVNECHETEREGRGGSCIANSQELEL